MTFLVGLLTTALSSGLAAAVFTSLLTEGKERWQLRRQKIEEIYKDSREYGHMIENIADLIIAVCDDRISVEAYSAQYGKLIRPDTQRLVMNIDLYEPSLKPALQGVGMAFRQIMRCAAPDAIQDYAGFDNLGALRAEVLTIQTSAKSASATLQRQVTQRGRRIANEPSQVVAAGRALAAWLKGENN